MNDDLPKLARRSTAPVVQAPAARELSPQRGALCRQFAPYAHPTQPFWPGQKSALFSKHLPGWSLPGVQDSLRLQEVAAHERTNGKQKFSEKK